MSSVLEHVLTAATGQDLDSKTGQLLAPRKRRHGVGSWYRFYESLVQPRHVANPYCSCFMPEISGSHNLSNYHIATTAAGNREYDTGLKRSRSGLLIVLFPYFMVA